MLEPLRQMFRSRASRARAAVPEGERIYLIGDIHGRLDLFEALITAIEEDDAAAGHADTTMVLLGDLVDRGPDSAGVIARAREWQEQCKLRILAGNHEEMFLESFEDIETLRHFLRHGGRETILSYGLDKARYSALDLPELQALLPELVPQSDRDFLRGFEEYIECGDYVFVHAGIAPEVPLDQQRRSDLIWIRERFLRYPDAHSHVVVHGHTITDQVDERRNRIGIDTGAFKSGRLTALVLEGADRRTIQAIETSGSIEIQHEG